MSGVNGTAENAKLGNFFTESLRSLHKFSDSLSGASDYSRAKTPRTQSDGPSPVIPNECEGSEKISPFGRNDNLPPVGACFARDNEIWLRRSRARTSVSLR
jgi:hypothetical protein